MKDDWFNTGFAKKWDTDTARGNPTRPEQLDILISIITDNYQPGKLVLDIGSGSGQVEELIFKKNPNVRVVGVDSSESMIELAKNRLSKFENNFHSIKKDIPSLKLLDLPQGTYQFVFSVQVFHELNDNEKKDIFKKVYDLLEHNGSLLILDRIDIDSVVFSESYKSIWNRLENLSPLKSNKTYNDYQRSMEAKEDNVTSAENYVELLKEIGFLATILHLHFNRALVIGVKK